MLPSLPGAEAPVEPASSSSQASGDSGFSEVGSQPTPQQAVVFKGFLMCTVCL